MSGSAIESSLLNEINISNKAIRMTNSTVELHQGLMVDTHTGARTQSDQFDTVHNPVAKDSLIPSTSSLRNNTSSNLTLDYTDIKKEIPEISKPSPEKIGDLVGHHTTSSDLANDYIQQNSSLADSSSFLREQLQHATVLDSNGPFVQPNSTVSNVTSTLIDKSTFKAELYGANVQQNTMEQDLLESLVQQSTIEADIGGTSLQNITLHQNSTVSDFVSSLVKQSTLRTDLGVESIVQNSSVHQNSTVSDFVSSVVEQTTTAPNLGGDSLQNSSLQQNSTVSNFLNSFAEQSTKTTDLGGTALQNSSLQQNSTVSNFLTSFVEQSAKTTDLGGTALQNSSLQQNSTVSNFLSSFVEQSTNTTDLDSTTLQNSSLHQNSSVSGLLNSIVQQTTLTSELGGNSIQSDSISETVTSSRNFSHSEDESVATTVLENVGNIINPSYPPNNISTSILNSNLSTRELEIASNQKHLLNTSILEFSKTNSVLEEVSDSVINNVLNPTRNSTNNGDYENDITSFSETTSLSVQQQVVIGAAIVVGIFAITALLLRIFMPYLRKRCCVQATVNEPATEEAKDISSSLPIFSFAMENDQSQSSSSQSDQSQTSSQIDWSDASSDRTKSTWYSLESRSSGVWKANSFGNLVGSTLSLPVCLPHDGFNLSRSCSLERLNQELMAAIVRKTMTPWRVQDNLDPSSNNLDPSSKHDLASTKSNLPPSVTQDIVDEISAVRRDLEFEDDSRTSISKGSVMSTKTSTSTSGRSCETLSSRELDSLCLGMYNNKYKAKEHSKKH